MKLVVLTFIFFSHNLLAFTPNPINERSDVNQIRKIEVFKSHASKTYLQISSDDLALIDEYIKLHDDFDGKDFEPIKDTGYFFRAIFKALENDKLPDLYLDKISNLAVIVYNYDKQKMKDVIGHVFISDLKELMWFIELRYIKDKAEIINFLHQSLIDDSENLLVLEILVQNNMFEQIQQWFDAQEIKEYELLIELLKRRSMIDNNKLNVDINKLLVEEYKKSVNQIFKSYKLTSYAKNELYVQHIDWLLKQMNIHKHDPDINKTLKLLNDDWLIFNERALNLIADDNIERKFRRIFVKHQVMWKTEEILQNKIELFGPDYEFEAKTRNYIIQKLESLSGKVK